MQVRQIQTVYVQTTPDNKYEDNETFTLALTNPRRMREGPLRPRRFARVEGTILNDDAAPSLSVADARARKAVR